MRAPLYLEDRSYQGIDTLKSSASPASEAMASAEIGMPVL